MPHEENTCNEGMDEMSKQPTTGMGTTARKEYHPVRIEHAENGFIVSIGCKRFVSKNWLEVSSKLQDYWNNPQKAEQIFRND
ncbi:hypothetical protein LCGC14_1363220 [marine sediment metagenome]|uniref:Uncharacterized protein n=1 Tax=marine sediment metagenome TaxID=412755 RepID=A0A0F9K7I3_9ZZZZ